MIKFVKQLAFKIRHAPVYHNVAWLMGDKAIRMLVNVFISVWMARYLGPDQFGLLSYTIAFVTLFTALATLGLERIVIRDLVRESGRSHELIGSAFVLQFAAGVTLSACAIVLMYFLHPRESLYVLLVALLSLSNVVSSLGIIDCWYDSRTESKFPVIAKNASLFIVSLGRVAAILLHAPVVAFAALFTLDILLSAVGIAWIYQRHGNRLLALRFSRGSAVHLLRESWPLIISSVAVVAYSRLDQVMLGDMVSNAEVGIYAAAVRFSEVWFYVATAIVTSTFPMLIKSKDISTEVYYQKIQKLFNVLVLIAYGIALGVTIVAVPVMNLAFGKEYTGAGSVLMIHIWALPFVFLGVARGAWAINEGFMKYIFMTTGLGTVMNIVLNLIFIPRLGAVGAAWALVLSQVMASYISSAVYPTTRTIFKMQTKALFPFLRLSVKASQHDPGLTGPGSAEPQEEWHEKNRAQDWNSGRGHLRNHDRDKAGGKGVSGNAL